jgi:hypothetical protein
MKLQYSELEIQELANSVVPNPDAININAPTLEQARTEVQRCAAMPTGFLYFLLTYCKFKNVTGDPIVASLASYNWQRKTAIKFLIYRYFIFYKTRQTGCSTLKQAHDLWKALFFNDQVINIFSLGQDEANEYLEKLMFMYNNLPIWLRTETKEMNKSTVQFTNGSIIKSKPNTEKGARSGTVSSLIFDEYAFYPKRTQGRMLAGSTASLGPGSQASFSSKTQPSQLFIISTLPETSTTENEYMRIFNEARENPEESKFLFVEVETDDIFFYMDKNWHAEQLEVLGRRRYETEILGKIHSHMENSFLDQEVLMSLESKNPIRTDFLSKDQVDEFGVPIDFANFHTTNDRFDPVSGYINGFWVWNDPIPGHCYGIMCDVAGGGSGDFSAFHVFDLDSFEQVAEYRGKVPTTTYGEIIETVVKYYNNAKFAVESTGLGTTLCQDFGERYPENFYFHKVTSKRYVPGFPLGTNRGTVLAIFENEMSKKTLKLNSVRTINELRNFGWNTRGRAEALEGSHDDLVMSLAEFIYLREIFFTSENVLRDEIEELERLAAANDVTRSRHFIYGKNDSYELGNVASSMVDFGSGLPLKF